MAWSFRDMDGRLHPLVDPVFIMAYDERSQVFGAGSCVTSSNNAYDGTRQGLLDLIALLGPNSTEKLLIGLPWYSYT